MSQKQWTGETAHQVHAEGLKWNVARNQLIICLSFFIGKTRTVLLAGLALKTQGSLVNGFTPLRAATAGFFLSFMFKRPPSLNLPFFFNSLAPSSRYEVTTALTCFGLSSVLSATLPKAALAVNPAAPAFFMAFIAGAIVLQLRQKLA